MLRLVVVLMLNSPYFFIFLSFIIFLYVGYRKIWPDIINSLKDDIAEIKKSFSTLETKKSALQQELKTLIASQEAFKDEIQKIHKTSLEHSENIKNVYMKDMEILSQNQFSNIDKIYLRMVQRFENESLQYFSKQLTGDLNVFFSSQKDHKAFHANILQTSLTLLQK